MTLSDLDSAFHELERRADVALDQAPLQLQRPPDHRTNRPLLVAASAAAVAAIAVGVGVATLGGGTDRSGAQAGGPPSLPSGVVSSTAPASPASTLTSADTSAHATDVPQTEAELIARFRSILGDSATFTVDAAYSDEHLITGVLTSSAGTRGLYVLEISTNTPQCPPWSTVTLGPTQAASPAPSSSQSVTIVPCTNFDTLPDGSRLEVHPTYPDGPTNGVMNDAILNRPDGWQISLYTANVAGKYEGAPVLGTQPALTTEQVTDVVTSPLWQTR